jgi:hypothetical protein
MFLVWVPILSNDRIQFPGFLWGVGDIQSFRNAGVISPCRFPLWVNNVLITGVVEWKVIWNGGK